MKLVIVSGLSGAGKSSALRMLEDLGFFCTDNLPLALLGSFVDETRRAGDGATARVAVGIDARSGIEAPESLVGMVAALRDDGIDCEVLFLEADDAVMLDRFSETRRRHPLTHDGGSLADAIGRERTLLAPIAALAELRIDTSQINIHELREQIKHRYIDRPEGGMSLQFQSFGFKHGLPRDADFVIDVRCLPNPHWEPELRELTGRDAPVAAFLAEKPDVARMISQLAGFFEEWISRFEAENRAYLNIAIGCTGGRHRSVYTVEQLAAHFAALRGRVITRHRELA